MPATDLSLRSLNLMYLVSAVAGSANSVEKDVGEDCAHDSHVQARSGGQCLLFIHAPEPRVGLCPNGIVMLQHSFGLHHHFAVFFVD